MERGDNEHAAELKVGGLELSGGLLGQEWSGSLEYLSGQDWKALPAAPQWARTSGSLGLISRALGQRTELRPRQHPDQRAEINVELLPLTSREREDMRAQLSAGVHWSGLSPLQRRRAERAAQKLQQLAEQSGAVGEAQMSTTQVERLVDRIEVAANAASRQLRRLQDEGEREIRRLREFGYAQDNVLIANIERVQSDLREIAAQISGHPPLLTAELSARPTLWAEPWAEADQLLSDLSRLGGLDVKEVQGQLDQVAAETAAGTASERAEREHLEAGSAGDQNLYAGLVALRTLRELARLGFEPREQWLGAWAKLWNGHELQCGEIDVTHRGSGMPRPAHTWAGSLQLRLSVSDRPGLGRSLRIDLIPEQGQGESAALREQPPRNERWTPRLSAAGRSDSPRLMALVIAGRLDAIEHPEEFRAIQWSARIARNQEGDARMPMVACAVPGLLSGDQIGIWSAAPLPEGAESADTHWRVTTWTLRPDGTEGRGPEAPTVRRLILSWLIENRVVWLCPQCGEDLDRWPADQVRAAGEDQEVGQHSAELAPEAWVARARRTPVRQRAHLHCPCCGGYAFISFCQSISCGERTAQTGVHSFLGRAMIAKYFASDAAFNARMHMPLGKSSWNAWLEFQINRPMAQNATERYGNPDPVCPRCGLHGAEIAAYKARGQKPPAPQ